MAHRMDTVPTRQTFLSECKPLQALEPLSVPSSLASPSCVITAWPTSLRPFSLKVVTSEVGLWEENEVEIRFRREFSLAPFLLWFVQKNLGLVKIGSIILFA